MSYKGYHLVKLFDSIKNSLEEYSRWMEVDQDSAYTYSLKWPDGFPFAIVQLHTDSVAVFVKPGGIRESTYRLDGFIDSRGWIHFRINKANYSLMIQDLLRHAFTAKAPRYYPEGHS